MQVNSIAVPLEQFEFLKFQAIQNVKELVDKEEYLLVEKVQDQTYLTVQSVSIEKDSRYGLCKLFIKRDFQSVSMLSLAYKYYLSDWFVLIKDQVTLDFLTRISDCYLRVLSGFKQA